MWRFVLQRAVHEGNSFKASSEELQVPGPTTTITRTLTKTLTITLIFTLTLTHTVTLTQASCDTYMLPEF